MRLFFGVLVFAAAIVSAAACAKLPVTVNPNPSGTPFPTLTPFPSPTASGPTPSSGPTPTPGPTASGNCAGQASNTTVIVVMSLSVAPTTDPKYGVINGYTTADRTTGTYGNIATVINVKTTDVIQFANGDYGSTPIYHSAVNFPNATSFPAVPYSFPSSTQQPIGTQITQSQWSTGQIPEVSSVAACFSQTFTLPSTGTYYFGDYNYYNQSNMRDVIVVQ